MSVSSMIATIVVVSGLPEIVLPGRSDHLRHLARNVIAQRLRLRPRAVEAGRWHHKRDTMIKINGDRNLYLEPKMWVRCDVMAEYRYSNSRKARGCH